MFFSFILKIKDYSVEKGYCFAYFCMFALE
jgi:hypothetical protein